MKASKQTLHYFKLLQKTGQYALDNAAKTLTASLKVLMEVSAKLLHLINSYLMNQCNQTLEFFHMNPSLKVTIDFKPKTKECSFSINIENLWPNPILMEHWDAT